MGRWQQRSSGSSEDRAWGQEGAGDDRALGGGGELGWGKGKQTGLQRGVAATLSSPHAPRAGEGLWGALGILSLPQTHLRAQVGAVCVQAPTSVPGMWALPHVAPNSPRFPSAAALGSPGHRGAWFSHCTLGLCHGTRGWQQGMQPQHGTSTAPWWPPIRGAQQCPHAPGHNVGRVPRASPGTPRCQGRVGAAGARAEPAVGLGSTRGLVGARVQPAAPARRGERPVLGRGAGARGLGVSGCRAGAITPQPGGRRESGGGTAKHRRRRSGAGRVGAQKCCVIRNSCGRAERNPVEKRSGDVGRSWGRGGRRNGHRAASAAARSGGVPGRGAAGAPSAPPAPSGQGREQSAGKGVPGRGSIDALPVSPRSPHSRIAAPLDRGPPSLPRRSELRAGPSPAERSGVGGEEGRRRGRGGGAAKGERGGPGLSAELRSVRPVPSRHAAPPPRSAAALRRRRRPPGAPRHRAPTRGRGDGRPRGLRCDHPEGHGPPDGSRHDPP